MVDTTDPPQTSPPLGFAGRMLRPEFRKIFEEPTTDVVKAGWVLGRGRNTSYRLAREGKIPVIPETGQVPTSWLARKIGLAPEEAA